MTTICFEDVINFIYKAINKKYDIYVCDYYIRIYNNNEKIYINKCEDKKCLYIDVVCTDMDFERNPVYIEDLTEHQMATFNLALQDAKIEAKRQTTDTFIHFFVREKKLKTSDDLYDDED